MIDSGAFGFVHGVDEFVLLRKTIDFVTESDLSDLVTCGLCFWKTYPVGHAKYIATLRVYRDGRSGALSWCRRAVGHFSCI